MWKKAVIVLFIAIIAVWGVLYVQKEKAADRLTQLLSQQQIEVQRLDFHFLPLPNFTAHHVRYCLQSGDNSADSGRKPRCLFFENIELDFSLFSALMGNFRVEELRLNNGFLQLQNQLEPDYQQLQITLKPYDLDLAAMADLVDYAAGKGMHNEQGGQWIYDLQLSGSTAARSPFMFTTKFKLLPQGVAMKNLGLRYNHERDFTVQLDTGYIKAIKETQSDYQIHVNHLLVNQQDLGKIEARVLLPRDKSDRYVAALTSSVCGHCTSNFEFRDLNVHTKYVQFSTRNFPADKLLAVLNLPVLLSGNADLQANITLSDLNPTEGKFVLNIVNGKVQGLNLLALVSQYLPINYDEDKVREAETRFSQYRSVFDWVGQNIYAEEITVQTRELTIKGSGSINLAEMKCDISMNVGLNNEKYQSLNLPVHFFDHCASPQYKVEFTPGFRKQLKQFLRDRFK